MEMELACAESQTVLEQLKQLSQSINENERMLWSLCSHLWYVVNGKLPRTDWCNETECAIKESLLEAWLCEQINSIHQASKRIELQLIGLERMIRKIG